MISAKLTLRLLVVMFLGQGCTQYTQQPASENRPAEAIPEVFKTSDIAKGDLTRAAASGDLRLVKLLIGRGAVVDERVGDGTDPITPLLAAIIKGQEATASFLISQGADLNVRYRGYCASDIAEYIFPKSSQLITQITALRKVGSQ